MMIAGPKACLRRSRGRSQSRSLRRNGRSADSVSAELAREDLLEPESGMVPVLLTQRLLQHHAGAPALELERGDLVADPGLVVHVPPAHRRVRHPRAAGERTTERLGGLGG